MVAEIFQPRLQGRDLQLMGDITAATPEPEFKVRVWLVG